MNMYEGTALIAKITSDAQASTSPDSGANIYEALASLSKFTRQMILAGDYEKVGECMQAAEALFEQGDQNVQTAITNVYVYSFSWLAVGCNRDEWHRIQSSIPNNLYTHYLQQLMQPGC